MDGNDVGEGGLAADALKEDARGDHSHFVKRLPDGGKAGLWKAAPCMSSKPTTEMSSGTRRPWFMKARMAPIAAMSLRQTRAVKSAPRFSSSW